MNSEMIKELLKDVIAFVIISAICALIFIVVGFILWKCGLTSYTSFKHTLTVDGLVTNGVMGCMAVSGIAAVFQTWKDVNE